jgi:hypothetical protein
MSQSLINSFGLRSSPARQDSSVLLYCNQCTQTLFRCASITQPRPGWGARQEHGPEPRLPRGHGHREEFSLWTAKGADRESASRGTPARAPASDSAALMCKSSKRRRKLFARLRQVLRPSQAQFGSIGCPLTDAGGARWPLIGPEILFKDFEIALLRLWPHIRNIASAVRQTLQSRPRAKDFDRHGVGTRPLAVSGPGWDRRPSKPRLCFIAIAIPRHRYSALHHPGEYDIGRNWCAPCDAHPCAVFSQIRRSENAETRDSSNKDGIYDAVERVCAP